jgi:hypothetical protein
MAELPDKIVITIDDALERFIRDCDAGVIRKGIIDVIKERARQVSAEGFDSVHDDGHTPGEMARAAACYCGTARLVLMGISPERDIIAQAPELWPWEAASWKPGPPRRDLVRAAALLIAEIDRLDRSAARKSGHE